MLYIFARSRYNWWSMAYIGARETQMQASRASFGLRSAFRPPRPERRAYSPLGALNGVPLRGQRREKDEELARSRNVVYWEFCIEILGPRCRTKTEDRRIHKALSRKLLKQIEEAAGRVTQSKLPPGLKAKIY
jgi:hypothetical protein